MAGRLEGKVAIITGGNSGIGEATVHAFAREGARVALMARREDEGKRVEQAVAAAGGEAAFIRCDVMDRASIEQAVAATVERFGRIDLLFNNAGGGFPGAFPKESDDCWENTILLNLTGTFRMTRAAWNHMVAAGGGSIINMSSFAATSGLSTEQRGLLPFVPPAAYASAKAGIEGFSRYVASVGAPVNIRVNVVRPGQILSPAANLPSGGHFADRYFASVQLTPGPGTPEDVANSVVFLASEDSRFINGQVLDIDGGATGKL
jgi:NAD(P)-dependent dehydrogenase (short-subunit alcohol dehydrogenase family)